MTEASLKRPAIQSWCEFWSLEKSWTYPELFKLNAEIFYRNAKPLLNWSQADRVMDIGCGPGFLEPLLAKDVEYVYAVDPSKRMVLAAKEASVSSSNVLIQEGQIPLGSLSSELNRFDLFLSISTIQYCESFEDVKELVRFLKGYSNPGARFLIADIPLQESFIESVLSFSKTIKMSIQEGYFKILFFKMIKEWKKILRYRWYSKRMKHLSINQEDFIKLGQDLNVKVEFIETNLSLCANRLNVLIHLS